jgi:hypothetical protein
MSTKDRTSRVACGLPRFANAPLLLLAIVLAITMLMQVGRATPFDVTWVGGTGNWYETAKWAGLPLTEPYPANDPPGFEYNVRIDNNIGVNSSVTITGISSTLNVNELTIDLGDTLFIDDNHGITVEEALDNNGLIVIGSASAAGRLTLAGPTTNSGTVRLGGNLGNIISATGGPVHIVVSPTHTITGGGRILAGGLSLENQNLIDANIALAVMQVESTPVTNGSTMQASGGGTLRFSGGAGGAVVVSNAGGLIQALNGSLVELQSAHILGGTLSTSGNGEIEVKNNGNNLLENVELTSNSLLRLNYATNIKGTFSNYGTVILPTTSVILSDNVTLTGNGRWTMEFFSFSALTVSGNDYTLTNGEAHTIEGFGRLQYLTLNNEGLVDANAAGSAIQINPAGALNSVMNTGTMQASDGGTLRFGGATIANTGPAALIQALDGSTVELHSTTITGGTLATNGSGLIEVELSGDNVLDGVTLSGGSQLRVMSDGGVILRGTMTNHGTVEQLGATSFQENVTLAGNGVWRIGLNQILSSSSSNRTLTNETAHTIEGFGSLRNLALNNKGLISANVAATNLDLIPDQFSINFVTNTGVMRATNGGTLGLNGSTYTNTGGTFEALNGSTLQMTGAVFTNSSAGTLSGGTYRSIDAGAGATMTLAGPAVTTIASGTTVELSGAGPTMTFGGTNLAASLTTNSGTLKLSNDHEMSLTHSYTQTASGALQVEVASLTNVGKLNSTGSATLAGQLGVLLGSGFMPAFSDIFTILDAASLSGTFQNVSNGQRLDTLGAEGSFLVTYNGGAGTVVLSNYLAAALPGDFNGDNKVDAADYVIWRKNGLAQEAYNTWRTHFGEALGIGAGASATSVIPEPTSFVLLILATVGACLRRQCA